MASIPAWRKITWAVDLFSNPDLQCSALAAAQFLVREKGVPIEPVYVLNRTPLKLPDQLPVEYVSKLEEVASERFDKICEAAKSVRLLPLKVLTESLASRHAGAQSLIRYAIDSGSDLIVASTHAKTGAARWFTGSFAETLMLYSDLPLLIVNPYWQPDFEQSGILFPTDFSAESHAAFELVLDFARKTSQPITIFHKVPLLLTPVYELSGFPNYNEVFQSQIDEAEKEAKLLVAEAWKVGVTARSEIDTHLAGSPSASILAHSDKSRCLIAMAARSGPVAAAVLGSTTREVLRGSRFPVWVVHPLPEEMKRTGTDFG